jgi:hypothetical protein
MQCINARSMQVEASTIEPANFTRKPGPTTHPSHTQPSTRMSLTYSSIRSTRATITPTGGSNRLIHQMKTAKFFMDNVDYP